MPRIALIVRRVSGQVTPLSAITTPVLDLRKANTARVARYRTKTTTTSRMRLRTHRCRGLGRRCWLSTWYGPPGRLTAWSCHASSMNTRLPTNFAGTSRSAICSAVARFACSSFHKIKSRARIVPADHAIVCTAAIRKEMHGATISSSAARWPKSENRRANGSGRLEESASIPSIPSIPCVCLRLRLRTPTASTTSTSTI